MSVLRRIWLAMRVFFLVLFQRGIAEQVAEALVRARGELPEPAPQPKVEKADKKPAAPKPVARPARSDAVTLLATLQREARFVDFVKEPLEGYSDAQIGAAARDVHRDCGKVIERLFAVRPMAAEVEGAALDVPAGFDAGRYRLTGNVAGEPPFHGRLMHHGWEATVVQLPAWSGSEAAAKVVAPVEVELG
jgi:hypothetical protein